MTEEQATYQAGAETQPFAAWCDISFMGHIHYPAAWVTEEEIAGTKFFRVEPLADDGTLRRPIRHRPDGVFSLEVMTEEEARAIITARQERAARRQQLLAAPRAVQVQEELAAEDDSDEDEEEDGEDDGSEDAEGLADRPLEWF